MTEILKVENLSTHFKTEAGRVKAVDDASFHIGEKEIVSIVGESGCGKSVSLLSVLQLVKAPGEIVGGKVLFEGKDLLVTFTIHEHKRSIPFGKSRGHLLVKSWTWDSPDHRLNGMLPVSTQRYPFL